MEANPLFFHNVPGTQNHNSYLMINITDMMVSKQDHYMSMFKQ